jgi:hypothetical protein
MTEFIKTKLRIVHTSNGLINLYLNDQLLECVESIQFQADAQTKIPRVKMTLLVPEIEIETSAKNIQLTSNAYIRCESCGKWLIPSIENNSIENNLNEKTVVAKYECKVAPEGQEACNWTKTVKIQDWNKGIK